MDCEKFDRVMLDLFYEELDEITGAAAKRHTEHCTRCRDLSTKLRATREVGALPLVDPPSGLEERILLAERRVRAELPLRQRLGRAISVLAGYAMRPQLAMAALLLLVIGSSLVLLRGRPGEQKNVLVTERGIPEAEAEAVAIVPLRERERERRPGRDSPAERQSLERREGRGAERAQAALEPEARADSETSQGAAPPAADRGYEEALAAYRDRRYEEAQRRFEEVAARGGGHAAAAGLYAAQSARARSGCPTAAVLFEQVYERFPESTSGQEAAWQAAGCYRTLGDFERARHHYESLLVVAGFADRAQAALASLGDAEPSEIAQRRAPARASAKEDAKASGRAAEAAAPRPAAAPAAAPAPAGKRDAAFE